MTRETAELVRHRLARAAESLAEANLLLANDHARTAVNRQYYACFQAVSALLLAEGHSSPKHSGVRALFDRQWIASGRLPKAMGQLYRRLFEARQRGDYADLASFDSAEIQVWIVEASAFVQRIAETIEELLA